MPNINYYTQRDWDRIVGYGAVPDEYSSERREQMGKRLIKGKNPKSKGKKVSHGNSHASDEEVRWDENNNRWTLRGTEK